MKNTLQYVNDASGNINAVQVPLTDWKNLLNKIKKYEQLLKIKANLKEAFNEVDLIQNNKLAKQSLSSFLDEL